MVNYNFDEDSSDDSDCDRLLREDIEALSRACRPTTTTTTTTPPPMASSVGAIEFLSDDDDDFDDLELVRSIQQRYGDNVAADIKPLDSLPPPLSDDDDDDDYEFCQKIKARFSQHVDNDDATSVNSDATRSGNDVNCRDGSVSNGVISTSIGRGNGDEHIDDTTEKEDASSFPLAAQTFIEAIKKNRSCQKFIRSKLLHIEVKMEKIKEVHKRLKTLRDFQVQCKKKIGLALSQKQDARIQLISVPKQRINAKESNGSAICYGPPENSYVAWFKATLEKYPLSFHREKWSKEDKQNLKKGIVRQYQEKMLRRSAYDLSSAEEPGVDAIMLSIKKQDITPETIQCFSGEVNWTQLASMYLPRRCGEECETRWLNHENRLINSGDWSRAEDKNFLSLLEKNGYHSWRLVAQKLGTNRTPYECLVRYQRSLNASILKKEWTDAEDALLCSAVESFGESNWQAVASVLEGRTGPQCSNRWLKTLIPARKRVGKWNDAEDKRLKVAVTLFGKTWHRIAHFVPGRTQTQCRERWVNVLDPSLSRCEWTAEEDKKLREAIDEHGYCWSKIAACLPTRTDNHCRRRWARLYPKEVHLLKAARSIQRRALITNFVDREEERPTIVPEDFISLPIEGPVIEQEDGSGEPNKKRRRKCKKIEPTEKLSSRTKKKKMMANKRRKKRKVDTEQSEGWEDLPLSVLFDKVLSRRR